jgi:DNA-binding response OmpR family regulator
LVILNHELPDKTGPEVAQLIRRRYSSLPIILEATVDQLSEKQLKDVDAYFLKSDSPNLLLRFVNLLLRDRQAAHAGD